MNQTTLPPSAQRMIRKLQGFRRRTLEFVRLAELAGESVPEFRAAADEALIGIRHLRAGKGAPLPPTPWLDSINADAEMEYTFKLSEFRKAQR